MKEEIIITGREIPLIDPHLAVWHWPIAVDLFLGGLAAGLLFFAAWFTISRQEDRFPAAVKWAPFFAPVAIALALVCLFIDLKHKLYFWQLYTTFRPASPMSLGSWILLFITPLSILWAASYLKELWPSWQWPWSILEKMEGWIIARRRLLAWALGLLAVGLGIYTGILLSAFNARPLWNTSLLAPMFLSYGLLTASAAILWIARQEGERQWFGRMTLALIGINTFFIVHLFMGFLSGPAAQVTASTYFLGGEFTIPFWGIVVGLGLVLPALFTWLRLRGVRIPLALPAFLILLGGLAFRFLMVEAGQLSHYVY